MIFAWASSSDTKPLGAARTQVIFDLRLEMKTKSTVSNNYI